MILTYPIITNARRIILLVSGNAKAEKISEIFTDSTAAATYPIQTINTLEGEMLWVLDQEAAARLEANNISKTLTEIT